MASFLNKNGKIIVENLIATIQENAAYLSEIDGAIGDGDHGINMNKGFALCQKRLAGKDVDFSMALNTLGRVLLMEIGGSIGPLYGTFFREMAKASQGKEVIDAQIFLAILQAALAGIQSLSQAKVGDKTLMDTLIPAIDAYENSLNAGKSFPDALKDMMAAAEAGKDSTKDLVAKIGRASRLGERSRGVLDTGATSCWLILRSMATTTLILLI
jgi:dihydroxyacetone kinase-like protein